MGGIARKVLLALGWALLGAAALAGVALSLGVFLFATRTGQAFLVPRVLAAANDAIAGHIELQAIDVMARGAVELHGFSLRDPDGDEVLAAKRVRLELDVSRLRSRTLGVRLEVDDPAVALKVEEDGGLSIGRAFAPRHPAPPSGKPGPPGRGPEWTVRLLGLTLRGGSVKYVDAAGAVAYAAQGLALDAAGAYGRGGGSLTVKLRGDATVPLAAPLALDLAAKLAGDALDVPVARVALGDTALDLVAQGDLARKTGRAALLSLKVAKEGVDAVAPRAGLAGDVTGTAYAESTGGEATAAIVVTPAGAAKKGSLHLGAAARLPPDEFAAGFDLALDGFDPARVSALAPPGELNVKGKGRVAGLDPKSLSGALSLDVAPSRVRAGRLGPLTLRARAERGAYHVDKLEGDLPGASLTAAGDYTPRGAVKATLGLDATDLAALSENLARLAGKPLPPLAGRAKLDATLAGTLDAPTGSVELAAPSVSAGGVTVSTLTLRADLTGKLTAPVASLDAAAARVTAGGFDARALTVTGRVQRSAGTLSFTAHVPRLGEDPITLQIGGSVDERRENATVDVLALSYPGTRLALAQPAHVALAGPKVDRLELASADGAERIAVEGGVDEGRLDARLAVAGLDLEKLPRGIVPEDLGVAGVLSLSAAAKGPRRAPDATAHVELASAAVKGVTGLALAADATWAGKARRATLDVGVRRDGGGELRLEANAPAGLAKAKPGTPFAVSLTVKSFPIAPLLPAAGAEEVPLTGNVSASLDLHGPKGAPALDFEARADDVVYGEYGPLALDVSLQDPGVKARLQAALDYKGARALDALAEAPLDLADALADPKILRGLRAAPLEASASIPAFPIDRLAGTGELPKNLAGALTLTAHATGSAAAPRATAALTLAEGRYGAWQHLGARLDLAAGPAQTRATLAATLGRSEVLRLAASLGLPVEELGDAKKVEAAPLALTLDVPRTDLTQAAQGAVSTRGTVEAKLAASGTLARPRASLVFDAEDLTLGDRPVGRLSGRLAYGEKGDGAKPGTFDPCAVMRRGGGDEAAWADLTLLPVGGGALHACALTHADLSLPSLRGGHALDEADLDARVVAERLDLGFLPAFAPDVVRSASGKVGADFVLKGPLADPTPAGTLTVEHGKIAAATLGEWDDLMVDAALTEQSFRLERFTVRHGAGTLSLTAHARGLDTVPRGGKADLDAELALRELPMNQNGQLMATVTMDAKLTGALADRDLSVDVTVPDATVKLPKKVPRTLQSLEPRGDIEIVHPGQKKKKPKVKVAGAAPKKPWHVLAHLLVPNRFFVKDENPAINLELKADVTAELAEGELAMRGTVDALRGRIEPIPGREFTLSRAQVVFTDGPPTAALVDVAAVYDNPAAKVTVLVSGPVAKPQIKMTSQPPMDEAQIAMLLATGRTELKAGGGGVGTLTGEQAAGAALGALATKVFKDVVADKLPVDSVSLDSAALRAGKYVTDKIYVGYTHRFNAQTEAGENQNEVRIEYQISPHWTFESRYGDSQTGAADLIWSKDY